MKKAILLIVVTSLIALWPFFRKGYFESHDGEWMVIRFTAFHQTLRSGQFPVRFVDRLNNNYGYPVMNFLYPLPFYLAEIPKLLGLGFVDSVKAVFVVSTILSSVLMIVALSQRFSLIASFAGAIIYLFSPYRLVDLYTRGSIGESVAFAIIPLCLLSIFKIEKNPKKYFAVLAVSIGLLITAHNVIALLSIPLLMVIALFFSGRNIKLSALAFSLGIFTTAFFWIPAMIDLKFVKLSQIKISEIRDHLVSIQSLLSSQTWLTSSLNKKDIIPAQIGILNVFIVIYVALSQVISKQKDKFILLLIIIFTVTAALMTIYAKDFWQNIPYVDVIQFPWRMLSIEILISSILACFLIERSSKKVVLSIIFVIIAILSSWSYINPSAFTAKGDSFYATNEDTTTVQDEYMPIWVHERKPERANVKFETNPDVEIINQIIKPANYYATLQSSKETQVTVNTIYFPGWKLKIDGIEHPIDYDSRFGLMNFKLPKGEHKVIINYSKTPVHLASEVVSLAALFLTGIYTIYLYRKQNSS